MDADPTADAAPDTSAGDPAAPAADAAEGPGPARARPVIDVSPALHEAGHEVADLGFEGVPDSGPVLHPELEHIGPDDPLDFVNVQLPSD